MSRKGRLEQAEDVRRQNHLGHGRANMGNEKRRKTRPTELIKRIWQHATDHDIFGAAAELAYYFMLALFPMLIFLTSLLGFLHGARGRSSALFQGSCPPMRSL